MTRPTAEEIKAKSARNTASWNKDNRLTDSAHALTEARAKKPSKMRNKHVQTAQGAFSSVREWRRYGELLLLSKSGSITDLMRQVRYKLIVERVHICDYVADFAYLDGKQLAVEDVKPNFKTEASRKRYQATLPYRMFLMKKRLMLAVHGIAVQEV